jgi:hypothetical protein
MRSLSVSLNFDGTTAESFRKTDSSNYGGFGKQINQSVTESIGMVGGDVVAILVGLVVFFIAGYMMFLKEDIG